MTAFDKSAQWKKWFRLSRLIPVLTILVAGAAGILSLLGLFPTSIAEGIIITLIALVAADALVERSEILERIENRLNSPYFGQMLRTRLDLPPVEEQAAHASEICILAISAASLSARFLGFFERQMQNGCSLRIVLLDPDSPSLDTFNRQNRITTTELDIRSTLDRFRDLVQQSKTTKGECEIHLSEVFAPFCIFAVNPEKASASMIVEYHNYKTGLGERPHVFLTPSDSPYWFSFYMKQFEAMWNGAPVWTP